MRELITQTGVPHWLQPPKLDHGDEYYEWTWEQVLTRLSGGEPMTSICSDPTMPTYPQFLRWIHKTEERKTRYHEAQELAAEIVVMSIQMAREGKNLDGSDRLSDVARDQFEFSAGKWLAGVWNKKRYGDVKQIDQTVTLDISEAMERAQMRVDQRNERVIEHD